MTEVSAKLSAVKALLFDKDGTLFGFQSTWGQWGVAVVQALSNGDSTQAAVLADAVALDLATAEFRPESLVIAGTEAEVAEVLLPHLPEWTAEQLIEQLANWAAETPAVEVVPLAPLLDRFSGAGFALGVATNDSAASARAQLGRAGVADRFAEIFGYDSGHGFKPGPGPCLAFAASLGIAPAHVAMVGDSTHDLRAGRAAGMVTVGVLTGPAQAADLQTDADLILPDIGHLPAALRLG